MAVQSATMQTTFPKLQGFPGGVAVEPRSRTLQAFQGRDRVTFGCAASCKGEEAKKGEEGKQAKTNFKPQTVKLWDKNLSFFQNLALFPIWLYQSLTRGKDGHTVLGKAVSAHCPYNPSCSEYTAEAIQKHGAIKGWLQGMYRVGIKCNPLYFIYRHLRYGEPLIPDPRTIEHPVK